MNDTPQLTQPPSTTATSTIPASHTTTTPVMSATSVLLPAGKTFSGADFGRRETLKARKAPADAGFLPTPPSTSPPPPMGSARLAPAVTLETQVLPPFLAGAAEMVMASRIAEIAQGFEDEGAFFVGDLGEVWKAWKSWKTHLPRVELFYAVKCNPDPLVLQLLASLGTGFDCASQAEIINVLSLPSPPDASRIIFANPCKPASFVRSARAFGVDAMTFDNKDELVKIAQLHPGARLVLRILTDDSKSLCRLGLKFGAPVETCPALLALARSLNLDVIGVSFHVGSGCKDPQMFEDAVVRARSVFEMGRREGYAFDFLDIGGGFEAENFVTTAEVLSGALERHFPLESGVRIIGEPGRFLVSSAFTLATNIIARRAASARINPAVQSYSGEDSDEELGIRTPVSEGDAEMDFMTSSVVSLDGSLQGSQHLGVAGEDADESGPKVMYYINDGVYGSFNCIMFDHQIVHPFPLTLAGAPRPFPAAFPPNVQLEEDLTVGMGYSRKTVEPASVWGPTCDSIDCVRNVVMLPRELQVGDWLGWGEMGAYTICAASTFNGFKKSPVHYTTGADPEASSAVLRILSGHC